MIFTSTEKQAIVSVLLAIMNADGKIATGEVLYFNQLKNNFNFSDFDFNHGKEMEGSAAMSIISSMNDEKKLAVGMMMHEMCEADGNLDSSELKRFNLICILSGVSKVIEKIK